MMEDHDEGLPPITELSKPQRRVLGVLIEKAFTTSESYPLTLKAATAGCNQKSNRSPMANYTEDDVYDTLGELRELGLAAVVHTESGRTERFRHYMRKRFDLSEPQIAILTELLLRGRQQLGELRSRASRMVSIESLQQLREELRGLMAQNLIGATGPLERRGIDVDHRLYQAREAKTLSSSSTPDNSPADPVEPERPSRSQGNTASAPATPPAASAESGRLVVLETLCEQLRSENRELREEVDSLRSAVDQLGSKFEDLRRDLGG
jgi:hypothetical protein